MEAIRLAAENNLDVTLQRETLRISTLSAAQAEGAFEPRVSAGYSFTDSVRIVDSTIQGMPGDTFEFRQHRWSLSLSKRFTTGTELAFGLANDQTLSQSNEAVAPDTFSGDATMSLRQPLLRGFSFDLEMPQIQWLKAKVAIRSEREQMRAALARVVETTEQAYWTLVSALKAYQVRRTSLDLAQAQMARTQRQIKAGITAPSAQIDAEITFAERELALIQAKQAIDDASDQLRVVLNWPRSRWGQPLMPVDVPEYEAASPSLSEAMATAVHRRPEARQVDLQIQQAAYDLREAENGALPQLDLDVQYALNGQELDLGGVYREILDRDAARWLVSLSLSWTPLNQVARASTRIAQANRRIARARLDRQVLSIVTEVRAAVRAFDSAQRQVLAAARFRRLATNSLDVEARKFKSGQSSNFLVAQKSENVARAQLAELGALIDLRLADVALKRSTGELLDARHVVVE